MNIPLEFKWENRSLNKHNRLDIIGIILSVGCIIHCVSLTLGALFLPILDRYFDHEMFHLVLFLLIVPATALTIFKYYKVHKKKFPLGLGIVGLALLFLGLFGDGHNHGPVSTSLTVIGSFALTLAHVCNMRECSCQGHVNSQPFAAAHTKI